MIFCIWFNYHPQLRYGGYLICFLLGAKIIIPIINIFIESKKNNEVIKLVCLSIFSFKIIFSINHIIIKKNVFENFPFYNVAKPTFRTKKYFSDFSINYAISDYCGITRSICAQRPEEWIDKIKVEKIKGYYFISKK